MFTSLSGGQKVQESCQVSGEGVNKAEAPWMPPVAQCEWKGREETDMEKIKRDMRAWRAAQGQPFHLAAGEDDAKNTLWLFFFFFFYQGREREKRECQIASKKKKKERFSVSSCWRPSFLLPPFVFRRRNQSRQLCYPWGLLHIVWLGWGFEFLPVVRRVREEKHEENPRETDLRGRKHGHQGAS